jgi:hypothetical protein
MVRGRYPVGSHSIVEAGVMWLTYEHGPIGVDPADVVRTFGDTGGHSSVVELRDEAQVDVSRTDPYTRKLGRVPHLVHCLDSPKEMREFLLEHTGAVEITMTGWLVRGRRIRDDDPMTIPVTCGRCGYPVKDCDPLVRTDAEERLGIFPCPKCRASLRDHGVVVT